MNKHYIIGSLIVGVLVAGVFVLDRKEKSDASARRLLGEAVRVETSPVVATSQAEMARAESLSVDMSDKAVATITPILAPKAAPKVTAPSKKTALLANGCFWCVENDLEKVDGVIDVVSGYAGGQTEDPTYKNYSAGGHREVVLVTYDDNRVSYANLVESIIKHGDPTDPSGSFNDRGVEYAPAIYFENETEANTARKVISAVDALRVFAQPLPLVVIPRVKFWPAEDYHQDYAKKNPLRYNYYRNGSGRNIFIEKYWGNQSGKFTVTNSPSPQIIMNNTTKSANVKPWEIYVKPSLEKLRATLTAIQFNVTQEDGTERSFDNAYDTNKDVGIYVDILSGEPLYLSKDKYDSGTGWPSFVSPINTSAVVLKEDKQLFSTRVEVRSRYGDNHLGHVFEDGPANRGGKRYCMNSAALRFIPKGEMEKEGYGEYLLFVE